MILSIEKILTSLITIYRRIERRIDHRLKHVLPASHYNMSPERSTKGAPPHCLGVEKRAPSTDKALISCSSCLAKMCETEPSSKMSLKVDNGTTGLLLWLFLFPTTVTKESKETQLLAGPNKRVILVYSSSKASLFQRRPEPIQSMRLRPTSQKGRNILRRARKEEAGYV